MKELKKSLLTLDLESGQPKGKITRDQISKRIIDFSENGIDLKKNDQNNTTERASRRAQRPIKIVIKTAGDTPK